MKNSEKERKKPFSLDDLEKNIRQKHMSKIIPERAADDDNKQTNISKSVSLDDFKKNIQQKYMSTIMNSNPNIDHCQTKFFSVDSRQPTVKIPTEINLGLSKDYIKIPSEKELYISVQKLEKSNIIEDAVNEEDFFKEEPNYLEEELERLTLESTDIENEELINPNENLKSNEGQIFITQRRDTTSEKKTAINDSPFDILNDNDLQLKFNEFRKLYSTPVNSETLLAVKFLNWIKYNPDITQKLTSLCEYINYNDIIEMTILQLISNTDLSISKIIQKLSWCGIELKRTFIDKFARSYLEENFIKRFPLGKKKIAKFKLDQLEFSNVLNAKMSMKFIEFHNIRRKDGFSDKKSYANTGRIIRDDFFNWIINNIREFPERIELLEMCEFINQNREIPQYILYLLVSSNLSQIEVVDEFKKLGLDISRETVRKVGLENFSEENYNKKFGKSVKSYQYDKRIDLSQLTYNSLLNSELNDKFNEFHLTTETYANDGRRIRRDFINFIHNNELDFEKCQFLLELCNNIESNREIERFIIAKIIKESDPKTGSQLSLNQISDLLHEFGLNVDRMTVTRIGLQHVFDNDKKKFSDRFPAGGQKDFRKVAIDHLDYNNILRMVKIFKDYHTETNSHPNHGITITPYFIDWIRNDAKEPDWIKNDILSECDLINKNSEILKLVLDKILNTNLNLEQIYFVIRDYGLRVSRGTISLHAQSYFFKNNKDGYEQRFPQDFYNLEGNLTHTALRYLLTDFFDRNYRDIKYYSEIRIFPPSSKKADGIILNLEPYNFLNRRFKDVNMKRFLNSELNLTMISALNIRVIQVDYTNDTSTENLTDKSEKYQNPYILLNIVDTRNKNKIIPINFITTSNFTHNVRINVYSIFSDFIVLHGVHKDIFKKIIEYNNSDNLEGLKKIINQFGNIKTHSIYDLKNDIGEQSFNEIFKDYQYNKDISPKNDFKIFSSFIQFCLDVTLGEKEITRGTDKGDYYIFTTEYLDNFRNDIGIIHISLPYLESLAKKFEKGKYIFYKKILLYNFILKKEMNKRVILIDKNFLNKLNSI